MNKNDYELKSASVDRILPWYWKVWVIGSFGRWSDKKYFPILLFAVTAFLLGRVSVIGESAPLGLGLFAAIFVYAPKRAWGVLICALIGALTVRDVGEVLRMLSAALLIWQGSIRWGAKKRSVRIPLLCGASMLAVGWLYQCLIGGSLYDGLIVFLSSVLAMVFSGLVLYGIRALGQRADDSVSGQVQEGFLAIVSVAALAVAGVGDLSVGDFGLQMMAGSLLALVLLAITELGIALAGCIGLGFVIGIVDGNVSMTMAEYALAGVMGGTLRSQGKVGCMIGFLSGLGSMLICFDPYGALWYMMEEAMIGAVLFALIPIRYLRQLRQYLSEVSLRGGSEARIQTVQNKLRALESLFVSMADAGKVREDFMADTDRQGQTAAILAAVEEAACSVCEKRKNCWEEDFFAVTQEVLSLVGENDSQENVQESFRLRCPSAETITRALTKAMKEQSKARYWKMQCGVQRAVLSEQMRSIGVILHQMEIELLPKAEVYRNKRQRIMKRLTAWGYRIEEMTIDEDGSVRMEVSCPSCGGERICEERILTYLERTLSMKLRMSVLCGAQNHLRKCRLFFTTQERVRILTGMVAFGREEERSGDTCEMISLSHGKTAILVSDGMGCGREASGDSQETIRLLKELLLAGFGGQTAVETLNAMLSLRDDRERFATIDVLIVNQYSGEAEFIKVGAPSAFIKRQLEVIVIRNESLPLGIANRLVASPIRMQLEDGDFIVMMSDGVMDIPDDRLPNGHTKESWVRSQIRLFSKNSPQSLAEHLAQMAIRLSGKAIRDDMTVVALKIKTVSHGL